MTADIGVLQHINKVTGNDSFFRTMAFTGDFFDAKQAFRYGYVSRVFKDKEEMVKQALEVAETIAKKSPLAVANIKDSLNFSRNAPVKEGLKHIVTKNQVYLQSPDLMKSMSSKTPEFPRL